MHKAGILSVCIIATFALGGCESTMQALKSYNVDGEIVTEDLNGRQAVEVYPIQPKDMSYVNFEPSIDHDVVQNEDVTVYDLENRNRSMSHNKRVETQSKARWSTLISMWRGGLNIGPSLYDDEKKTYNE